MNNNQYYILKYNLKYALTDPNFSEKDKQTIRQAEQVSKAITNGFYVYALGDVIWSVRGLKRAYGHNSHTFIKMKQKSIFLMALRLFILYEACEYGSMMYLVKQTEHLVKKNHPLKEQFKQ